MRFLVRLATLCLSLALLGGMLGHDLAGAKMSLEMASAATVIDAEQGDICPACTQDTSDAVVCDMDCTAPVLSTVRDARTAGLNLRSSPLETSGDLDLAGLDPGSDPFPPRSTFLS
ncbi:hypothetical protein D6850_11015 [Roseovarius spongiae]|uniref:Secreted protein n=1 Tax=Roseovarius spongiae TaxID=2320272 RepID=A0A3A8AYI7_9RHOB|nr:hypothetical protein [Roseovarius spongiae]RKF15341.1 hypothetical protein D6850_11015 [Roseovarius spongiae]